MFSNADLFQIDISVWDVSSVENMNQMFNSSDSSMLILEIGTYLMLQIFGVCLWEVGIQSRYWKLDVSSGKNWTIGQSTMPLTLCLMALISLIKIYQIGVLILTTAILTFRQKSLEK